MHCYRQRITAIATTDGAKYRQDVIEEYENHDCHDAALKAKRRCDLWSSKPMSVRLLAGLRRMETDMFLKVSAYVFDVYNDVQRGTLSAWSWPSRVLTRLKADEAKINSFSPFVPSPKHQSCTAKRISQLYSCNWSKAGQEGDLGSTGSKSSS